MIIGHFSFEENTNAANFLVLNCRDQAEKKNSIRPMKGNNFT